MEPTVLPYDSQEFPPIPRQDYSNIPIQQKGLHAKGFDFMRLSKDIEGHDQQLQPHHRRPSEGKPADKLAAATHTLGGNFDGKIFDYDLADMQVAIITGAGSGIGLETATMLHEEGMAIVGVGRSADKLKALEDSIADPARLATISVDIAADDAPKRIVKLRSTASAGLIS